MFILSLQLLPQEILAFNKLKWNEEQHKKPIENTKFIDSQIVFGFLFIDNYLPPHVLGDEIP